MRKAVIFLIGFLMVSQNLLSQAHKVYGKVFSGKTKASPVLDGATVFVQSISKRVQTNQNGYYEIDLQHGSYILKAFSIGKKVEYREIVVDKDLEINFFLEDITKNLEAVEISDKQNETSGISRLKGIEGLGIYEAKKNELIMLEDFAANKVTNNARQVFAKVPGLNIWESDYAGIQLDIAARGLGPSRTANFNTRQNGYDMSADALGYPESYYMPSMQAVERIEIVRGAASLQYGTQFGGMLNFKLKEAADKPFEIIAEQAIGSFGLINSYASVGGTLGKVKYFGYYQYRQGDGWRENSAFDSHLAFSRISFQVNDRLSLGFEYSFMNYKAQQPGGLTDEDFDSGELEKSRRDRNWFQVNWNLLASTIDFKFNDRTKLNLRTFGLFSSRDALGNLQQIDRIDNPNENRTLISDRFENYGSEIRLLHYYDFFGQTSALLVGGRYYNGLTDRQQGDASSSAEANFSFLNPDDLEDFDYDFPSRNYALFMENVINVSAKTSITPGIRFEHIRTDAMGTWKQIVRNFAGDITVENEFTEDRSVTRSFVLFGLGISHHLNDNVNLYTNFSENFRSVTFSDLRLNNPNFLLDSLIEDESGYNFDVGVRGNILSWLNVDVSFFYLRYNDRIGVLLPPSTSLLFRTNVGDSRHYGLEAFAEMDVPSLIKKPIKNTRLSVFTNISLINATYIRSQDRAIEGNKVEYVPEVMFRSGVNYSWKDIKATYQFSFLGEQFSDATNSIENPNALTGIIPSYHVMDLSVEYSPQRYKFTFGVNNLTNEQYFTRRAESYPGPGIIPATIRSYYLSFGIKI
ncbi:MAG TPA: TonB-dependent receptor domain-containing protein [Cyclobacteriaceae bacterium]